MKTKTTKTTWLDVELPFDTSRHHSTLADLKRLDPDQNGWNFVRLTIWASGFKGKTETGNLLGLLLDDEGHRYDTQADWDWLTMTGTIQRLTDLIDCHLISKGRRS